MDSFSLGLIVSRSSTHSAPINKLKNLLSPLVNTAPTGKILLLCPINHFSDRVARSQDN